MKRNGCLMWIKKNLWAFSCRWSLFVISISLHLVFHSINMQIRLKLNALLWLLPSRWKIKRNSTWSRKAFACSLARWLKLKVSVEFSINFLCSLLNAEEKLMKFEMEFTFNSFLLRLLLFSFRSWTSFLCNFHFNAMGNNRANQFSQHIFRWNYLSFRNNLESHLSLWMKKNTLLKRSKRREGKLEKNNLNYFFLLSPPQTFVLGACLSVTFALAVTRLSIQVENITRRDSMKTINGTDSFCVPHNLKWIARNVSECKRKRKIFRLSPAIRSFSSF